MNPTGDSPGPSGQRFLWLLLPAMLCVLVSGCPHNDYTVELKPNGSGMERTLTFYRADGNDSNGVPNYQSFPSNELMAITAVYPANAVTQDGQRYIARGEFAGSLPHDIGGVGSCTNFSTSLGSSGFYLERFRGNDNLVARTAKQFQAADQITDLAIGWARTEFGHEHGYEKLQQFLDKDFRQDLKNAGLYFWVGQIRALSDTNAIGESVARFGQYLLERGYLKLSDITNLNLMAMDSASDQEMSHLVRRLITEKMGISESEPSPKSFDVLVDSAAFEKSWTNYLPRSDFYRAKVMEWEEKKKTNPEVEEPKPLDAAGELFVDLVGGNIFGGETDHLTVKLTLNQPPDRSNGKWQDGQVVWSADLETDRALPVLCYASWSIPDAGFQKEHFGKVVLDGDGLSAYCLWLSGLDRKQAGEWEKLLAGLQPGKDLKKKLEAFRFAAEPTLATGGTNQLNTGPQLLIDSLAKDVGTSPSGSP